jgi:uncharacterized protein YjbI with pentapeptide repeats
MRNLSLAGAYLRNASFGKRDFSGANFSGAFLGEAQFTPNTVLTGASFAGANLVKAKFYAEQMKDISEEDDPTSNMTNFSLPSSIGCKCDNTRFDNAILTFSDFSYANLRGATFIGARIDHARLVAAIAIGANFTEAILNMANCTGMNGAGASFNRVKGVDIDFRNANLTGANFMWATNNMCDFSKADMSYTLLTRCQLYQSIWTNTKLVAANLSRAYMFDAYNLTDEQLLSAVSIEGTQLPNGTLGYDKPLVKNGLDICNMTLKSMNDSWWWRPSDELIMTRSWNNYSEFCAFAPAPNSTKPLSMFQQLDLRKYQSQIATNKVVLLLSATFGNSTTVALEWPKLNTTESHQRILGKNIL